MAGLFETISSASERLEETQERVQESIKERTPQKPEDIEVRIRPNEHSYMKKQDEIIHIETSQVHKATGKRITLDMPLKEFLTDKMSGLENNPDLTPLMGEETSVSAGGNVFGTMLGRYRPEGYPEAQRFFGGQTERTPWYLGIPTGSHVKGEIEIVIKGKSIGSFKYYLNEGDFSGSTKNLLFKPGDFAYHADRTSFKKLRQITEPLKETARTSKNKLTAQFLNSIGRYGPLRTDRWIRTTKGQPWYATYRHPPLPGVQSTDMFVEAMKEFYYPDKQPNPVQTIMEQYKMTEGEAVKFIEDQIAFRAQWSLAEVITYINKELRRTEKGIHKPLTSHSPDQDTFLANCIKRPVHPFNHNLYTKNFEIVQEVVRIQKSLMERRYPSGSQEFTPSRPDAETLRRRREKLKAKYKLFGLLGRSFFCIDSRRGKGFDKLLDVINTYNPEGQMMIINRIADAMRAVGKAEMRNFNLGFYMFAAHAFNPGWAINWSMERYERMQKRWAEERAQRMAAFNLIGGILEATLSIALPPIGIPFALARRGMQVKSNLSKLEAQAHEQEETQEQVQEETEEFREELEEDQGVEESDPAKDPKRIMKKLAKYGAVAGVAGTAIWSALELTD